MSIAQYCQFCCFNPKRIQTKIFRLIAKSKLSSDHAMITETQLKWTIEGESNPIHKLLVNFPKMLSKKVKEIIDLAFDNLYENNRYFVE